MSIQPSHVAGKPASHYRRFAVLAAVLMLLVCLFAAQGGSTFRSLLFENNLHVVVPGHVYRSAQPSPKDLPRLADRLGLKSIVNLRGGDDDWDWFRRERAAAERCGLQLYSLHLRADRLPGTPQLRELLDVLTTCPRPVLIHCRRGIDRTGLASALVHLLDDAPVRKARREFGLRYGYVEPFALSEVPEVLDRYEHWLHVRQDASSADLLREWVGNVYIPYNYRAEIEAVQLPERIPVDQPMPVRFRVTNRSWDDWLLSSERDWGFHLGIKIRAADPATPHATEVRGERSERLVAPGETVVIEAELPPFPKSGRYRLVVDMVDETVVWFAEMGSPPLETEVVVTPLAEAKAASHLK